MKPRNTLEVKGAVTAGALALAFGRCRHWRRSRTGTRSSAIRSAIPGNRPRSASQTEGKIDAHEQARTTIVGTQSPRSPERASSVADGARVDAHEQARRLLLAQPVVTTERTRSGS